MTERQRLGKWLAGRLPLWPNNDRWPAGACVTGASRLSPGRRLPRHASNRADRPPSPQKMMVGGPVQDHLGVVGKWVNLPTPRVRLVRLPRRALRWLRCSGQACKSAAARCSPSVRPSRFGPIMHRSFDFRENAEAAVLREGRQLGSDNLGVTRPRQDLTRITLAVRFIGSLLVASFWVLRPFLAAIVWPRPLFSPPGR